MKNALRRMFMGPSVVPDGPPQPSASAKSDVVAKDEPTLFVPYDNYLRALDRLRDADVDAYEHVLEHHRGQLGAARRVRLFNTSHARDYIANVAVAQDMKCRTLEQLVDDMERTTRKLEAPEKMGSEEPIPAGILAGS